MRIDDTKLLLIELLQNRAPKMFFFHRMDGCDSHWSNRLRLHDLRKHLHWPYLFYMNRDQPDQVRSAPWDKSSEPWGTPCWSILRLTHSTSSYLMLFLHFYQAAAMFSSVWWCDVAWQGIESILLTHDHKIIMKPVICLHHQVDGQTWARTFSMAILSL